MPTNGLIATLRALTHEIGRVNQRLADEQANDDESVEEVGRYLNDLHEAIAATSAEYESRRVSQTDLCSVDALIERFSRCR